MKTVSLCSTHSRTRGAGSRRNTFLLFLYLFSCIGLLNATGEVSIREQMLRSLDVKTTAAAHGLLIAGSGTNVRDRAVINRIVSGDVQTDAPDGDRDEERDAERAFLIGLGTGNAIATGRNKQKLQRYVVTHLVHHRKWDEILHCLESTYPRLVSRDYLHSFIKDSIKGRAKTRFRFGVQKRGRFLIKTLVREYKRLAQQPGADEASINARKKGHDGLKRIFHWLGTAAFEDRSYHAVIGRKEPRLEMLESWRSEGLSQDYRDAEGLNLVGLVRSAEFDRRMRELYGTDVRGADKHIAFVQEEVRKQIEDEDPEGFRAYDRAAALAERLSAQYSTDIAEATGKLLKAVTKLTTTATVPVSEIENTIKGKVTELLPDTVADLPSNILTLVKGITEAVKAKRKRQLDADLEKPDEWKGYIRSQTRAVPQTELHGHVLERFSRLADDRAWNYGLVKRLFDSPRDRRGLNGGEFDALFEKMTNELYGRGSAGTEATDDGVVPQVFYRYPDELARCLTDPVKPNHRRRLTLTLRGDDGKISDFVSSLATYIANCTERLVLWADAVDYVAAQRALSLSATPEAEKALRLAYTTRLRAATDSGRGILMLLNAQQLDIADPDSAGTALPVAVRTGIKGYLKTIPVININIGGDGDNPANIGDGWALTQPWDLNADDLDINALALAFTQRIFTTWTA